MGWCCSLYCHRFSGFSTLVSDGAGGAIFTWEDRRSGQADIYAQRLNTSGAAQWAANGIAVCSAGAVQNEAQIVPRISGGATIIWTDLRNSSQEDIYAQAVTLAGAVLWTANGVPVANESHSQFASHLIADGGDGAIIAWQDSRSTLNYDIYSSKLFSDGTLPVKLSLFTATLQNKNALLQWQTSNELNVAKYNIQRSLDGNSFTTKGAVHSTGNSTATKNYSYTDNTISNLNAGRIYYRLQIVDINGKVAYSNIEVVKPAADMLVSIAPNPVHDHIIVSSQDKLKMLSIINIMGQVLKTVSLTGTANQQKIEVRELPAGNYFIKAVGEDQVWTKQFIKL
ncbi:MAG: T9SS type A sorting domain-containing protein [Chitinophagaceae bacterium]|nr:T9SS type A sorting domain-containing protein [Chitinophagaceae bacterium]